jgi:hypothetical protein
LEAGQDVHCYDQGHSDVHGQKLCAKIEIAEHGLTADKLVQALRDSQYTYPSETGRKVARRDTG